MTPTCKMKFWIKVCIYNVIGNLTRPSHQPINWSQCLLSLQVSDYCEQPVTHPDTDEYVPPYIWNFYHSFFFSFIVCSTVGKLFNAFCIRLGVISDNRKSVCYQLCGMNSGIKELFIAMFFFKMLIEIWATIAMGFKCRLLAIRVNYRNCAAFNYCDKRIRLISE